MAYRPDADDAGQQRSKAEGRRCGQHSSSARPGMRRYSSIHADHRSQDGCCIRGRSGGGRTLLNDQSTAPGQAIPGADGIALAGDSLSGRVPRSHTQWMSRLRRVAFPCPMEPSSSRRLTSLNPLAQVCALLERPGRVSPGRGSPSNLRTCRPDLGDEGPAFRPSCPQVIPEPLETSTGLRRPPWSGTAGAGSATPPTLPSQPIVRLR